MLPEAKSESDIVPCCAKILAAPPHVGDTRPYASAERATVKE
jgi:hypothetical protein